jgi:hypothetical protein
VRIAVQAVLFRIEGLHGRLKGLEEGEAVLLLLAVHNIGGHSKEGAVRCEGRVNGEGGNNVGRRLE